MRSRFPVLLVCNHRDLVRDAHATSEGILSQEVRSGRRTGFSKSVVVDRNYHDPGLQTHDNPDSRAARLPYMGRSRAHPSGSSMGDGRWLGTTKTAHASRCIGCRTGTRRDARARGSNAAFGTRRTRERISETADEYHHNLNVQPLENFSERSSISDGVRIHTSCKKPAVSRRYATL